MNTNALDAIRTIRRCIESGRYVLKTHFIRRMDERGIVWPDVLAIFNDPSSVDADAEDDWGRARWIVSGTAADRLPLETVCVLDRDEDGELTIFITLYWEA